MDGLEKDHNSLAGKIDNLTARVDDLTAQFNKLEGTVTTILFLIRPYQAGPEGETAQTP